MTMEAAMRWCWIASFLMVTNLGCTDSANKATAETDAPAAQVGATDDDATRAAH